MEVPAPGHRLGQHNSSCVDGLPAIGQVHTTSDFLGMGIGVGISMGIDMGMV